MNPPTRILLQAIAEKTCVEAVYNRMQVRLAPHILYTKHDEIYVDAVTLWRDGKPPRELKLGSFKLDGLKELELGGGPFSIESVYDPAAERYQGVTLFAV